MNDQAKSILRWLIGLPARLLVVLILAGILLVMLMVLVAELHIQSSFVSVGVVRLLILALLAGYTWSVYFGLPFFLKRARWQRILISSVPAFGLLFLSYLGAAAIMSAILSPKSDRRVESVTLPSGEILENHTYYEAGWGEGDRFNKLFLKNPATGKSELVGDFNYEANQETPSLFAQFPHPQKFTYRNKKVLVIGPYLCDRINSPKAPYWDITTINWENGKLGLLDNDARAYLKSFRPTNNISSNQSPLEMGSQNGVQFDFDSLDLTNNILTVKKQKSKQGGNPDEFPPYLVFSALGYNADSIYTFPSKFDESRTRAKNGPQWEKAIKP